MIRFEAGKIVFLCDRMCESELRTMASDEDEAWNVAQDEGWRIVDHDLLCPKCSREEKMTRSELAVLLVAEAIQNGNSSYCQFLAEKVRQAREEEDAKKT